METVGWQQQGVGSELEWTESWSVGLLSGPGLGLETEMS